MKISNPIAVIGENFATKFLENKGYKIIERNFRKGYGEIDIIAVFDNILIFVEVKTRTGKNFGTPLESITYSKLKTLTKTAEFYKLRNPRLPEQLRIDAVSVSLDHSGNLIEIEHVENISY